MGSKAKTTHLTRRNGESIDKNCDTTEKIGSTVRIAQRRTRSICIELIPELPILLFHVTAEDSNKEIDGWERNRKSILWSWEDERREGDTFRSRRKGNSWRMIWRKRGNWRPRPCLGFSGGIFSRRFGWRNWSRGSSSSYYPSLAKSRRSERNRSSSLPRNCVFGRVMERAARVLPPRFQNKTTRRAENTEEDARRELDLRGKNPWKRIWYL